MRFLYSVRHPPQWLPKISASKPNAQHALDLATSNKVPPNILGRAKYVWSHREHLEFFDGSYLAGNPQIWAEQQLGLACVTHLGQHILCSYRKTAYNHDNDDESIAGSIQSHETMQLEGNISGKFGGNAH